MERSPLRGAADAPAMGYQPSLDGVRAVSVVAVVLYHAGFNWVHGGFFGVEVFFVVSGFLITSLLVEERDRAGRVDLRRFWVRRWRRLLPALFTMMVAVSVWAVFFGTAEQHTQVRRDLPWAIGYLANWGTVLSESTYFSGSPSLFRHLWSLAVEEQWYVVWPLVFLVLAGRRRTRRRSDRQVGSLLASVALAVMAVTALAFLAEQPARWLHPFGGGVREVDTTNFLYLSTITRSSGLLLGAAMAFLWRPWRIRGRARGGATATLDVVALVALAVLVGAFAWGDLTAASTYLFVLPMVTLASAALVGAVVHPWAGLARVVLSSSPLAALGRRSYGIYLWSWPISRIVDAYRGSVGRFVWAMALTAIVSEACYRYVETPIRRGALGAWWAQRRATRRRPDWNIVTAAAVVSSVAIIGSLSAYFSSAPAVYDPARDRRTDVVFDASALAASTTVTPGVASVPVTAARLPRRVVIVGDSTAHSLAVNLPAGIETNFAISDGSLQGCSVYDRGVVRSSRDGFGWDFAECVGWEQRWVQAATASEAEVALVVLGAWDVFDVELGALLAAFGTADADRLFVAGLQRGIDALAAVGTRVALLEVPCMRPQDVEGAGVPALPERGDDGRVARVNDLLRKVAAANPDSTVFVAGPDAYCTDPTVASDLSYRWDGVHAGSLGAKLTFETIAAALLAIPVP